MYSFINKTPTTEDIKVFKMEENINENFINYKDFIFLLMPTSASKK